MGFFSNLTTQSKSIDLERLLNETLKVIFDWENKKNGDTLIKAANAIRNNTYKIVNLYGELIKSGKSRNIWVKNTELPPNMPKEFDVDSGLQAIFEAADALAQVNSSFRNELILPEVIKKYSELPYPF